MKKNIILIMASLLFAGLLIASNYKIVEYQPIKLSTNNNREETIFFIEDFEDGAPEWSSIDVTDPGSFWNTSTYNSFEGSGKSWRMADPDIIPDGGYLDGWYQVLDTPVISLPNFGNLTLTFEQFRAIEELGEYENFNGWDGFNIRIRTSNQDYEEAEILTDCIPAYNSTSMYSFGYEHGEDPDGIPGIPGWGGSTDWTTTTITIPDSYLGEDVIISFAFASDPNISTATNPEFTGVFIDNIDVAGVFTNDGEDETGFYCFSNTDVGGNLWHIFEPSTAYSPTHALGCFDFETCTYNPNMENYIESPTIDLPSTGQLDFDMYVRTELDDIFFPDCDYFSIEVSYWVEEYECWTNWNSISNPTGDPGLENVVFTGSVDEWTLFSEGWPGYNDLSSLAGYTIKLRIGFHSNENTPDTFGIYIDDIMLLEIVYPGSPPENLTIELLENFSVKLIWNRPSNREITGYNIYHTDENCGCYELIDATVDSTFIHINPTNNSYNYYVVTALYNGEETQYSNEAFVFVPSSTANILMHDDGTCESGFNVGTLNNMAVKFTPNYNRESQTLTHINVYIESSNLGPLVIKIWDDNNGIPGDLLANPISFSSSELVQGWNTLIIPTGEQPILEQGSFFAGIQEFENLPAIGLDESSSGYSYTDETGWEIIDAGNIMIRAIVDSNPTGTQEDITQFQTPTISNYPNPFNPSCAGRSPETTIKMNIPHAGKATLKIFNIKGQLMRTLHDGYLQAGNKIIKWNGLDNNNRKVTSGVYFYNLQTEDYSIIKKMLMLK